MSLQIVWLHKGEQYGGLGCSWKTRSPLAMRSLTRR